VLGTAASPAKTDEPIEMLFRQQTRVGPGNHVLDESPDPPGQGAFIGGHISTQCPKKIIGRYDGARGRIIQICTKVCAEEAMRTLALIIIVAICYDRHRRHNKQVTSVRTMT